MKKKTLIAILWPVTILLALWLGALIGTRIGTDIGRADASNKFTWGLCSDLGDIGNSVSDPQISGTISNVRALIQTVGRPEYPAGLDEFRKKTKELQNQPVEGTR